MSETHRAFGKVILLGEHAVVYGHPALAAALHPGAEVTARTADVSGLSLTMAQWDTVFRPEDGTDIGRAVGAIGERLGVRNCALDGTLHLPGGGGLGSSAALGVACIRAMAPALDPKGAEILDVAFAWEKVFHGTPSGLDHTLAALGGVRVYVKGQGADPVHCARPLRLLLGDTGERASTRTMVDGVRAQRERHPEATDRTLDAIASLVRNAALALPVGDTKTLGDLMNLNQMLLASLFLSTERIESLCAAAREAGALGAKLTGAGGGGCVVALCPDDNAIADAVLAAWAKLGARGWAAEVAR